MLILRGQMAVMSEMAGGCRFLQFRARGINEIKDGLEAAFRLLKRVARHDNSRTAMPLALMLKGEFNFGALGKTPLGQEADTLWRPLHPFLG